MTISKKIWHQAMKTDFLKMVPEGQLFSSALWTQLTSLVLPALVMMPPLVFTLGICLLTRVQIQRPPSCPRTSSS